MTNAQKNKHGLKVGTTIDVYYSNGNYVNSATVTKITESSCYLSNYGGHRESWNTVNKNIENGTYKII